MLFVIILILGCAALPCLGAPPKDIPTKVTPEQAESVQPKGMDSPVQKSGVSTAPFTSEWGFFRQVNTGMIIYSEYENCSVLNNPLRVGYNNGKGPLEVRFKSEGRANYGCFETKCGTAIGPESATKQYDPLVLQPNCWSHFICEESNRIFLASDVLYQFEPHGVSEDPRDGTKLVMCNYDERGRFQFVPSIGPTTAYFTKPELSGEWLKLGEVIVSEPGATYPHELQYTVGRTVKYTEDPYRSWRPSPTRAFEWFRDSQFNFYACRSESVTWDIGQSRKEVFEVSYGVNIFYRWHFFAQLHEEIHQYQSSIITIARARNAVPEMMHAGENEFC